MSDGINDNPQAKADLLLMQTGLNYVYYDVLQDLDRILSDHFIQPEL